MSDNKNGTHSSTIAAERKGSGFTIHTIDQTLNNKSIAQVSGV